MGMFCPQCKSTFGTISSVGGDEKQKCPSCKSELIATTEKQPTRVIANYTCECGSYIGHMSVVGSTTIPCSGCGKEI